MMSLPQGDVQLSPIIVNVIRAGLVMVMGSVVVLVIWAGLVVVGGAVVVVQVPAYLNSTNKFVNKAVSFRGICRKRFSKSTLLLSLPFIISYFPYKFSSITFLVQNGFNNS